MLKICIPESGCQQFNKDGTLVRDYATGDHVGIYQISEKLHKQQALSMGWDIETPEGNIAEALWLYKQYGTSPWLASKPVWSVSKGP